MNTRKRADRAGYVYFVRNAGLVKIGRTDNWQRRFKQFSTTMPFMQVLALYATFDMYALEKYYHRLYASKRVRGEWSAL